MKNYWKLLIPLIIIIFAFPYSFDLGLFKGEITEYSLSCDKEKYVNYRCLEKWLPLNPTTYKPNTNKQQVLYWTLSDIQTLKKCSVVNRKNWTCRYDDESAEFGFKDGQFWEASLGKSISDDLFETRYVSKLEYRLEEMKWW